MPDQYTETTTTSYGSRIGNSISGIVMGVILFVAAFPLIWWNEGHSVKRIKALDEGRGVVIPISAHKIDPNNDGKLIHLSGKTTTDETLKDSLFGVQLNALKLKRTTNMYQWIEHETIHIKTNLDGSETKETTYSYNKGWSEALINSNQFKIVKEHENPPSLPYGSRVYTASNITIGNFKLTTPFIEKITNFEDYSLSQKNLNAMDKRLKQHFKLNGNEYFYGDPANLQIGAIRIKYSTIMPTEVSVIGKQNGNSIDKFYTKNGEIHLLEMGVVQSESMFETAKKENALITWGIRLGGWLLMWLGLSMIFRPIEIISSFIPFFGYLVSIGIGLVTLVASFTLSLITMAFAWIFYRPLIGIIILVLAVSALFGGWKIIQEKIKELNKTKITDETTESKPAVHQKDISTTASTTATVGTQQTTTTKEQTPDTPKKEKESSDQSTPQ